MTYKEESLPSKKFILNYKIWYHFFGKYSNVKQVYFNKN